MDPLISFCVPCGDRLDDLQVALPFLVRAACASPPVEVFLVDYGSTDGLGAYLERWRDEHPPECLACEVNWRRYEGPGWYHMAHARNLSVLGSRGDWIVILSADTLPAPSFVPAMRRLIAGGSRWMGAEHMQGIVAMPRVTFIEAGGYDERLDLYGREDKDLNLRLLRRGLACDVIPDGTMQLLYTPDCVKVRNYRLKGLTKKQMGDRMHAIFAANVAAGVLVANAGREWGRWDGPPASA